MTMKRRRSDARVKKERRKVVSNIDQVEISLEPSI
jgi:hypothetical protein